MIQARLGIAGLGLIGGSIALRARAGGHRVVGFDRDRAAVERARERGAVDDSAVDLGTLAGASDFLILALPVDATAEALEELARAGVSGPVIDVASVKAPLAAYAARLRGYVGTHPMAGRERGGIDAADARLFEGATWAHVPHLDRDLVAQVREMIAEMGARPMEIEAGRHDEIVALTSHLPQALSVALAAELLAGMAADSRVIELCGPGMMSMLRLARSPAAVWSPIVTANAEPLSRQLRSIAKALLTAADGLERGDSSPLMSYFDRARGVADALEERFPPVVRS